MPRLELTNIHTYYGTSHILFDVSLEVGEGESVCLLGRNGAGKTTTLKTIMGLAQGRSGAIRFNGESLLGRQPYEIAQLGVGFVPDERLIFPDLTVRENLELGGYLLAVILTSISDEAFVNVAWDSAGVTTGPVTVPLVLAMGLGLGRAVQAQEGFGILAMASVGPIITVLAVSLWAQVREWFYRFDFGRVV